MRANGSAETNLTNRSGSSEGQPVWSPDGSELAFWSDRDGNVELYVMKADGTGQRRLTNSPSGEFPSGWSRDGRGLLFHSDRGNLPGLNRSSQHRVRETNLGTAGDGCIDVRRGDSFG